MADLNHVDIPRSALEFADWTEDLVRAIDEYHRGTIGERAHWLDGIYTRAIVRGDHFFAWLEPFDPEGPPPGLIGVKLPRKYPRRWFLGTPWTASLIGAVVIQSIAECLPVLGDRYLDIIARYREVERAVAVLGGRIAGTEARIPE